MSYLFGKYCLKFSRITLFLLFFQSAKSQTDWSDVDNFLQSHQKDMGKDFVMMVWKKDDTVVYKKEMGTLNSKTQGQLSHVSQWLTAALVMVMVDEGKVSLDDKVSTYLPEFARYGKNYITLRTCLSHMTGVSEQAKFLSKVFQRRPFASLEEEANHYASKEIRANPTTDFWYGNLGINIAGRVLEVATKKRFDVLIKQKLFTPLTMRRSSFTTIDASPPNPSAGAITTGDDFVKFIAMLLNKGRYGNKQILSEESVAALMQVHARKDLMKFSPELMKPFDYALGAWVLEEKENQATAFACPGWLGSFAIVDDTRGYGFLILPKEKIEEEKSELYLQMVEMLNEKFGK